MAYVTFCDLPALRRKAAETENCLAFFRNLLANGGCEVCCNCRIAPLEKRLADLRALIAAEESQRQAWKRFEKMKQMMLILLCRFVPVDKWAQLFRHLRHNPPGFVVLCLFEPEELDPELKMFLSFFSEEQKEALLALDPTPPVACAVAAPVEAYRACVATGEVHLPNPPDWVEQHMVSLVRDPTQIAATKIQRIARGFIERRRARRRAARLEDLHRLNVVFLPRVCAAMKIQRIARGFIERRRYERWLAEEEELYA